jgi:hypothetical protein
VLCPRNVIRGIISGWVRWTRNATRIGEKGITDGNSEGEREFRGCRCSLEDTLKWFSEVKWGMYNSVTIYWMLLYNDQRNAQVFYLFIYLLLPYMFRAFF